MDTHFGFAARTLTGVSRRVSSPCAERVVTFSRIFNRKDEACGLTVLHAVLDRIRNDEHILGNRNGARIFDSCGAVNDTRTSAVKRIIDLCALGCRFENEHGSLFYLGARFKICGNLFTAILVDNEIVDRRAEGSRNVCAVKRNGDLCFAGKQAVQHHGCLAIFIRRNGARYNLNNAGRYGSDGKRQILARFCRKHFDFHDRARAVFHGYGFRNGNAFGTEQNVLGFGIRAFHGFIRIVDSAADRYRCFAVKRFIRCEYEDGSILHGAFVIVFGVFRCYRAAHTLAAAGNLDGFAVHGVDLHILTENDLNFIRIDVDVLYGRSRLGNDRRVDRKLRRRNGQITVFICSNVASAIGIVITLFGEFNEPFAKRHVPAEHTVFVGILRIDLTVFLGIPENVLLFLLGYAEFVKRIIVIIDFRLYAFHAVGGNGFVNVAGGVGMILGWFCDCTIHRTLFQLIANIEFFIQTLHILSNSKRIQTEFNTIRSRYNAPAGSRKIIHPHRV